QFVAVIVVGQYPPDGIGNTGDVVVLVRINADAAAHGVGQPVSGLVIGDAHLVAVGVGDGMQLAVAVEDVDGLIYVSQDILIAAAAEGGEEAGGRSIHPPAAGDIEAR